MPTSDTMVGFADRYTLTELTAWQRADGPPRVGLQVGHLNNTAAELPDELAGLANNAAGATWGPYNERDVNAEIVRRVAAELKVEGVEVDVLPATIPPGYEADAFLSIHADGNRSESVRGFKIAAPRRDFSTYSEELVAILSDTYGRATGLPTDSAITGRMSAYYAFNWPRFEHAVHPRTPAVIVETGFLTNADDRAVIVATPERSAAGIADGIVQFLEIDRPSWQPPSFAQAPTFPLVGTLECATLRPGTRVRDIESCMLSIRVSDDLQYVLTIDAADEEFASLIGQEITIADAKFTALPALDNFLWYRYAVAGELSVNQTELSY